MTVTLLTRKNQTTNDHVRSSSDFFVRENEDGTLTFPVSSETPYRRYFGNEILLHSFSNVNLEFLGSGNAPLLDSHRRGLTDTLGVVERAYLDKKRLYVVVRFANSQYAQEIRQMVEDGIVKNVSVGYSIDEFVTVKDSEDVRVTKWTPREVSFVSIPADSSVGIGRNRERIIMTGLPGLTQEPQETDEQRSERLETNINEITALAQEHNLGAVARSYIQGELLRGDEPRIEVFRGIARANLPEETPLVNNDIGLNEQEKKQFSIVRVMRAQADGGNWSGAEFEHEAVRAAVANSEDGPSYGGVLIPTDVMDRWGDFEVDGMNYRDLDARGLLQLRAAIATSANTNVLDTSHMASRFIDNLRNESSVLRAGVTMMPGLSSNVEIPGGDQNLVAAWLAAEDANVAESVPTFRNISLDPKDLGAFTDVTRRMLQQATIAMEAYIRSQMIEAHRLAIDIAGLYGTGATGQPLGIANTPGIGSVSFAGARPTRGEMIDLRTAIAETNRGRGINYIANSDFVGYAQQTEVAPNTGRFLMDDSTTRLVGNGFIESNQATDGDLFAGVFSDMILGMWGGLEIARSTEAKFLSGGLRFRSIQTVDYAVTRVGSFALGN